MNQQLTKALFAVATDKKAVFGDMHKTPFFVTLLPDIGD